MGFWAATLAWGQRVTIINKSRELISLMDGVPYDFIINHQDSDLKRLLHFKHRTFNDIDTLYYIAFFRQHYQRFSSLEDAFLPTLPLVTVSGNCSPGALETGAQIPRLSGPLQALEPVEAYLNYFRSYFFSLEDYPPRTKKHVSSPAQKSTCKRLNMFLRWMVRKDEGGVDFGIWDRIKSADLICPLDLHVDRVSRKLLLITRKQTDWQTAVELTKRLRQFDPQDPVKYDFALFGLGIEERWGIQF